MPWAAGWSLAGPVWPAGVDGGIVRLYASGEFDLDNQDRLADALQQLINNSNSTVELDLTATTFISVGVVHLLSLSRDLAVAQGCVFRVLNATGSTAMVIKLTGNCRLLPECPEPETAGGSGPDAPSGST